jgi:Aminoglycoside-2''-adenylyltransferase
MTIVAPYGPWEPARPAEAAAIFAVMPCPWWIAGGYAIELAAGRPVRAHGDIDVLVLRRDQAHVQQALAGWQWWAADPPGTLRPWQPREHLPAGICDIWCRPGPRTPWRIQVMLDESQGRHWVSRRDPRIRRPITSIGKTSSDGIPYLAPEIQLLYKAANPRPKDETDFTAVLPCLTQAQRHWLRDALTRTHGQHPWHHRLTHTPPAATAPP